MRFADESAGGNKVTKPFSFGKLVAGVAAGATAFGATIAAGAKAVTQFGEKVWGKITKGVTEVIDVFDGDEDDDDDSSEVDEVAFEYRQAKRTKNVPFKGAFS